MAQINAADVTSDDLTDAMAACYCLLLRQTSRRLIRHYDTALEPYGLTIGQFGLLTLIATEGGAIVQDLADAMDMNQSALSRGLGPLERDGWIVSQAHPKDGRKRVLTLTPSGRENLRTAAAGWRKAQDAVDTLNPDLAVLKLVRDVERVSLAIAKPHDP